MNEFIPRRVFVSSPHSRPGAPKLRHPESAKPRPEPRVFVMAGGGLISLVSVISYFSLLLFLALPDSACRGVCGAFLPLFL